MIKQEEVNKAYEEFRNYWDGLGFPEASDRYVRLAFNEGYKAAKQSKVVVVKPVLDVKQETEYRNTSEKKLEIAKQLTTKLASKKHYPNGRNKRSSKVVADDSYKVSEFLKTTTYPVNLSVIVKTMNRLGKHHWNTNNASAFMRLMIKDKYPVVKVSHGVYQYKKDGK